MGRSTRAGDEMSQVLEILDRLIGFESVSANSNLDIAGYIEEFLTVRGFSVTRVPDETGRKVGLYASLGPAGHGILLSAHTDVVPVVGQKWTREPFSLTRQGARLYGRGTTDMKGYIACMMAAADRATHRKLKEPLKLALSYDEEIGCIGIGHMIGKLESSIGLPRACFVGEPTEMRVAVGHKGKVALCAICSGQGGHSALAPKFVNAIHLATDFVNELRDLQKWMAVHGDRDSAYDISHGTIHVGRLFGGTALNIVPDRAEVSFEYRHLATDPVDGIHARILAAAERTADHHSGQFAGVGIEVERYNSYPGLDVREDAPVVGLARTLAGDETTIMVPFGTEAGYFDALDIPTVVCGPGSMEGQGHKPDEYITMDQIAACETMMDRVLDEIS